MVPAFLAAHLICICAQPTFAAPVGVGAPETSNHAKGTHSHDCCHRQDDGKASKHDESPRCQHCSNPQLTGPDSFKLSSPLLSALPAFLSAPTSLPAFIPVTLHTDPLRGTHSPPPSVLLVKCVLLI